MRKLTVLVDMDDVLELFTPTWVTTLNSEYGLAVEPKDVRSWNFTQYFPTLTREQVYAPLFTNEFWRSVGPKNGAADALQRLLADGHEVYVVTASSYQTLTAKMEDVLFKYFPFLTWNNVIVAAKKQLIRGDVLVDDGIHNLEGGEYAKVLFDMPHNWDYDAETNGMTRVQDWAEAYSAISKLAGM